MSPCILVTGATGSVGREVIENLAGSDCGIRAAIGPRHFGDEGRVRPATASLYSDRLSDRITFVPFDFTDEQTWDTALTGVTHLFLMRPPHVSNIKRDMAPFLEHIASLDVQHVSFLSVRGAESNSIIPHHKIEQYLIDLNVPYSFFRPSFFMQNLTTTHLHEIRDERRIFVPAGDGQTNFVDVRDIGEAIATTLLDPPGENSAYEITGPADLTYYEVAGKLSDHLEIDITYVPAGLLPFFRYHRARGKKFGFILVMYILYRTTKKGKAAGKSPDLQRLIGRPPRSLDEFIVDHKQLFVRNGTDG